MGRYVLRRLAGMLPVLLVILTIAFVLVRVAPGGPFDSEKPVPAEVKRNLELKYHLREPWCEARFFPELAAAGTLSPDDERALRARHPGSSRSEKVCAAVFQYGWLLWGYAHGDLGPTYKYKDRTVNEFIAQGLPVTMTLALVAMIWALVVGLGAGIVAAMRQNRWQDSAAMSAALLGISVPSFVLGPVLIFLFSITLTIFPPARWDGVRYMILPGIALGSVYAAYIARLTRGGMLEVIRQDYIRTARAKGLPERLVVLRHAVRGGLIPVVSYLGPALAGLFTGSLVIERIFNIPGIGRYFVDAALNRDYTLAMGVVVVDAVFLLVANLLVDIAIGILDPRVRYT